MKFFQPVIKANKNRGINEGNGASLKISVQFTRMKEWAENISPFRPNGGFHGRRYSRLAVGLLQRRLEMPWP